MHTFSGNQPRRVEIDQLCRPAFDACDSAPLATMKSEKMCMGMLKDTCRLQVSSEMTGQGSISMKSKCSRNMADSYLVKHVIDRESPIQLYHSKAAEIRNATMIPEQRMSSHPTQNGEMRLFISVIQRKDLQWSSSQQGPHVHSTETQPNKQESPGPLQAH